jgi:hypothetical protein
VRVRKGGPIIRIAATLLLAAALAPSATAANVEIPQRYLDQEVRTRAALTPAEQARVNTHVARLSSKMSLQDVKAMTQGDSLGSIFVVMMEYLKLLQKEAREDRKTARTGSELSLATKAGKLDQANAKIEAQKREAEERFQRAMTAANSDMVIGIVCGLASMGAAGQAAGGPTGHGTANVPASAARLAVTPIPVKGIPTPTKTPTRTPAPGK